jgi:hypothetical protein
MGPVSTGQRGQALPSLLRISHPWLKRVTYRSVQIFPRYRRKDQRAPSYRQTRDQPPSPLCLAHCGCGCRRSRGRLGRGRQVLVVLIILLVVLTVVPVAELNRPDIAGPEAEPS